MKNRATWGIVGALAVAGAIGVSLQPGGKFGGDNGTREVRFNTKQAEAKASETEAAVQKRACDGLAQVLELFLTIDKVPRPDSCKPVKATAETTAKPDLNPKFVIATLPDPIHTHLALMFDRMAEVIQQAAQDERYSYEASWLPWDDKEETYVRLADEDQASYRKELSEDQPGILVFRRGTPEETNKEPSPSKSKPSDPLAPYHEGLIVFVVGEDPTRGIHTEQFTNALAWIDKLRGLNRSKPSRTAILGPTFSGSFPSLAKLLSDGDSGEDVRKIRGSPSVPLPIYSGTANSAKSIINFNPQRQGSKLADLHIDFHGFLERDEVGLERYCEFVSPQGNGPSAIAIISEDETAYGEANHRDPNDHNGRASPEGDPDAKHTECLSGALWLYYPRDISALRSAYQTNSIFNTTAPQQSSDVGRGRLPTDLADSEGQNHDTIRSYAGNQTSLSQEAYLLGLANAMRVHHIQYVILRSTNPIDQLFLARYFRRAYPDARIVTDNSDRLFERDPGLTGMGGTMSLSTYPLLERERRWVDGSASSPGQRLFNSDSSEGTYIAFRLLLHTQALDEEPIPSSKGLSEKPSAETADICALQGDTGQFATPTVPTAGSLPPLPADCNRNLRQQGKPPIPDYGMPSWVIPQECQRPTCDAYRRPATWLTVLGRDGYWAIAAMNEQTTIERDPPDRPSAASEMPLSIKLWLVFLAGFVGFHVWCCWGASFTAKPSFRTHFANPDEYIMVRPSPRARFVNTSKWPHHTLLIFLGGLFVAMLPLFTGWGCGAFDLSSAALFHPWRVRGIISLECLFAIGTIIANILRMDKLVSGRNALQSTKRCLALIVLACSGSALGIFLFFVAFALPLQKSFMPANRFFTYYRSMHLLSGVSPVVPLLALTLGMYAWFWHSLHGLALFGADRCKLPAESDLWFQDATGNIMHTLRMFSQEEAADGTEDGAKPLASDILKFGMIIATGLVGIALGVYRGLPVRSLGAKYYAAFFLGYLVVCFTLMLAEAWQLLRTWARLRQLLMFLDRTPLRRTLAALRGFSWGSVWGMSGNVLDVRYKLLSRQIESLGHTLAALKSKASDTARCCIAARSCIAMLAKLKQIDKTNQSYRVALAESCLDALKQLRKSTTGSSRETLDAARDCIVAQKMGTVMADPAAMAGVRECISALENFVTCESEKTKEAAEKECIDALEETRSAGTEFAKWYARNYLKRDAEAPTLLKLFQLSTARTAATLLVRLLLPEWRAEKSSLILVEATQSGDSENDQSAAPPLSEKQHIRDAEEFVCLPYMGFVQNILGRMRSMVMSILWLFVATAMAISSYPFDPRQGLSGTILVLFILLGGIIFYVYAQMHRDATLSHVTNTKPGELGGDFWLKIVSFGIVPLLGLLTTIFPGMTDFVFSWLQPGLQSIK
jgi:hypothetical protein